MKEAELKENEEEKNEEEEKTKKVKEHKKNKLLKIIFIIFAIIIILFALIVSAYVVYNRKQKDFIAQKTLELEAIFIGEEKEIEYGTEIKIEDLEKELLNLSLIQDIDSYTLKINNENQEKDNTYKFTQINNNEILCTVCEIDNNKKVLNVKIDNSSFINFFKNFEIKYEPQEIKIEKTYNYNVVDTQKPVIEGVSDKEIYKGEEIDLKSGISAKDPVDGDLEFTIEGEVKKDEIGDYKITVKATDKNSNETSAEFNVKVKEKPVVNTPTTSSSKSSGSKNSSNTSSSSNKQSSGNSSVATYTVMPSMEQEMFNLTNQYRASGGLSALKWDSTLASIARKRSLATAHLGAENYGWGHFGTEYGDIFSHLINSGVSFTDANEIIAWNYSTSAAVKWLYNSPLHKAAMMGNYNYTGCGVCKGPDGEYLYFQVFAQK